MTDDEIWAEYADIGLEAEEGNLDDEEWWRRMGDLRDGVDKRRRELVGSLRSTPEAGNRASMLEAISEYRRLSDGLRSSMQWRARRAEQRREREMQQRYAEANLTLARSSNELAAAGHAQAKSLTFWTRWLAVATVVLAGATVVLVLVTALQ